MIRHDTGYTQYCLFCFSSRVGIALPILCAGFSWPSPTHQRVVGHERCCISHVGTCALIAPRGLPSSSYSMYVQFSCESAQIMEPDRVRRRVTDATLLTPIIDAGKFITLISDSHIINCCGYIPIVGIMFCLQNFYYFNIYDLQSIIVPTIGDGF